MEFMKKKKYYNLTFIVLCILLFITMILSSTFGAAKISSLQALYIICRKIPFITYFIKPINISESYYTIIYNIRLPRIVLAGLVGMGLSIVGTSFQALFKNPMADPYVLGISSGAALGAAIAITLGISGSFLGFGAVAVMAFAGSLITAFLVYNIARVGNRTPTVTLLLAGVTVSFFLSSIISLIMVFNYKQVDKIVFWMMGSFSASSFKQVILLIPFIFIGLIIILSFSRDLNIMLTGDDTANSLGIEAEVVKKVILAVSSAVVAACVSVSGVIGFVGLIVPHIIRMLVGPNHRILIPFSAVSGAIFMIVCDTLARSLASPSEIPVGAITSFIGAPYFIYLLMKSKKKVL